MTENTVRYLELVGKVRENPADTASRDAANALWVRLDDYERKAVVGELRTRGSTCFTSRVSTS